MVIIIPQNEWDVTFWSVIFFGRRDYFFSIWRVDGRIDSINESMLVA